MIIICFKQKTAYEVRISDWSSDVCSSDLQDEKRRELRQIQRSDRLGKQENGMAIQANHRKLGMIAAAAIFLSDQIMKYIVVYPLALQSRQTIELLPFFDLHFVRNFGVSMGFFRAASDAMRWDIGRAHV